MRFQENYNEEKSIFGKKIFVNFLLYSLAEQYYQGIHRFYHIEQLVFSQFSIFFSVYIWRMNGKVLNELE